MNFPPERCTNEIPATSNPANCDAVACGNPATYPCEEGPRCASCYRESGLALVVDADETQSVSPLWRLANVQAAAELDRRHLNLGLATLESGPAIEAVSHTSALDYSFGCHETRRTVAPFLEDPRTTQPAIGREVHHASA